MKLVADRKVCFDAAKKASTYREFRSILKNKGCTQQMLKEAWAAKDEKSSALPSFKTPKTASPVKSIKKAAQKKKVTIRKTPPAPREYEKYLSPVSGEPDRKHVARLVQVKKQSHKVVVNVDFLPEGKTKLTAVQKKVHFEQHKNEIEEAIKDLLYGYDVSAPKFAKTTRNFTANIKANQNWIGNETTIAKSVESVFKNPNLFIEDGKKCVVGGQILKLTLKEIKTA